MKRLKIFCFSYAGGTSNIFNNLKYYVNGEIDVIPIEYPGRGNRIKEEFKYELNELVDDAYDQIKPFINNSTYALLGYSMGSWVAYELASKLQLNNDKLPEHLFLGAQIAPHRYGHEKKIYDLPDEQFIDEVFKLGGTPAEIKENKELQSLFIPVLKADYQIVNNYQPKDSSGKLDINITTFFGTEDKTVPQEMVSEWGQYTNKTFKYYSFKGDHFFIHNNFDKLSRLVNLSFFPFS